MILDVLDAFRAISASERGNTRLAYTEWEDRARDVVRDYLRALPGYVMVDDAAGNLFVVPEEATGVDGRPIVLIGSHVDTVIEGGWLDGTLGVAAGIASLSTLGADPETPLPLGLVVFRDEEGVRFNSGLFGSHVFAGLCQPTDLAKQDRDGCALGDVVPNPAGCLDYTPPVTPLAYLECHIEQGLRLEDAGARVGLVTGMVGIRRYDLTGVGQANHAGTTEMRRRVDALTPVAEVIGKLPVLVEDLEDTVITCGRIGVRPGAPNIVPGTAQAVVEIRSGNSETIEIVSGRLQDLVAGATPAISGGRCAELSLTGIVDVPPTRMDGDVLRDLASVVEGLGLPHLQMPSMAGHDAQHAAFRCPAGMFFIPSLEGISHAPDENSRPEDIEMAAQVMTAWAQAVLARLA